MESRGRRGQREGRGHTHTPKHAVSSKEYSTQSTGVEQCQNKGNPGHHGLRQGRPDHWSSSAPSLSRPAPPPPPTTSSHTHSHNPLMEHLTTHSSSITQTSPGRLALLAPPLSPSQPPTHTHSTPTCKHCGRGCCCHCCACPPPLPAAAAAGGGARGPCAARRSRRTATVPPGCSRVLEGVCSVRRARGWSPALQGEGQATA